MWTGVEPEMGVYNETYIQVISDIIDDLVDHGIHPLLDVHQDVISSYFCLYDAAPTWLIDLSSSSEKEFPWPLAWDGKTLFDCLALSLPVSVSLSVSYFCLSISSTHSSSPGTNPCPADRSWGTNYLAEATGAAFQDLYDNVNGMRDHFGKFWSKVVSSFKDKAILGYEIINEPWVGNPYKKPSLLLPGIAGKENLQPFYDVISATIRQEDSQNLIFYEPVTWGMIFNGTVSGSGFDHVPGGSEYVNKSVFSFHYYCWWFTTSSEENFPAGVGEYTSVKQTCDQMFGPKVFEQVHEDIRRLGGSAMMTEWGLGCDPTNGVIDECDPIMDLADEYLTSWIDWWWTGPLMDRWNAQPEAIAIYSRTYAQSVAGIPSLMRYEASTHHFRLCYEIDTLIVDQPTVIYVNDELAYPQGVNVHLTGVGAEYLTVAIGPNHIYLTYDDSLKKKGERKEGLAVCVDLTPK
jgi:endoglycosylceramidase